MQEPCAQMVITVLVLEVELVLGTVESLEALPLATSPTEVRTLGVLP